VMAHLVERISLATEIKMGCWIVCLKSLQRNQSPQSHLDSEAKGSTTKDTLKTKHTPVFNRGSGLFGSNCCDCCELLASLKLLLEIAPPLLFARKVVVFYKEK
jgi:hypothetical protein